MSGLGGLRGMVALLLALALGVLTLSPAVAARPDGSERAFRWADRRIGESSGLVDRGSTMVTTNDSGDQARLFVVDRRGRTLRTIDYGVDVRDVEALAPAGPDHVWVGDIGDNRRERCEIRIHRVRVDPGPGPRTRSYRLVYPGGKHYDAESLVRIDGRTHLITKGLTGGLVFRAPQRLRGDGVNRLRQIGRVGELATDAGITGDGRHALVRGLAGAGLYELPQWRRAASMRIPGQGQGEGVSLGPGDRVRLSSEGTRSWVWQTRLPESIAPRLAPAPTPTTTPTPTPPTPAPEVPEESAEPGEPTASGESGEPAASGESGEAAPAAGTDVALTSDAGLDRSIGLLVGIIGIGAICIGLALRRRDRPEAHTGPSRPGGRHRR